MNQLKKFSLSSIPQQIEVAFLTTHNIAGTLHGQRKITQGQAGKRTALFPSQKNGGAIPVESRLELTHALNLERDPQIKEYRTQSLCLQLDSLKLAYPDFLIRNNDGTIEVHEVKPSISALNSEEIQKFELMENFLKRNSIRFKLIDSSVLPSVKTFNYLMHLYARGHRHVWTSNQRMLAIQIIESSKAATFEKMHKILIDNNIHPHLAEYLVFHDYIELCKNEKTAMHGGSL